MGKVSYLIPAFIIALASASSASNCLICHSVMQGRVQTAKGPVVNVHIEADEFYSSVHGKLDCEDCHTGFGPVAHSAPAQDQNESIPLATLSLKAKADPAALGACDKCHPQEYEKYKTGVHGQALLEKGGADAPLCLDCHGNPHYLVPEEDARSAVNHANVLATCGKCHDNEALAKKYGFSSHVIEKYKESFHGKKYILGDKRVPVCNDCHGGHLITRVDDPGSPVSGEGKIQTCGKCHKGATAKFAAAPAHKYIGKENPIPYYAEKGLIVLLLGTFGFVFAHVALDSWSEIRDRVLRRKEDDDE